MKVTRYLFILLMCLMPMVGFAQQQPSQPLVDFSSRTLRLPNSTTLPATCSVGQIYFDTDATAGQNIYGCTATNTWTLERGTTGGTVTSIATTSPITGGTITSTGAIGCATCATTDGANVFSSATGQSVKKLLLPGSTSGTLTLVGPATAGSNTFTFPAGTTDFSATGGTSQVVKQTSAGGALTVAQLAASDLSNGTTGSGAVVLATGPTLGAITATSLAFTTGTQTLIADAVDTLAIRRGTNAQALYLYSTYTDASNYSRLNIFGDSSDFYMYGQWAGTGTAHNLQLGSVQARWTIEGTVGHLTANSDNTQDIGASGATRPRTGYFGTSVVAPVITASTSSSLGAAVSTTMQVGGTAGSSNAPLVQRAAAGNAFEFGHTSAGGYTSTVGGEVGSGVNFLCLHCEAGTTSNTYRTRGFSGSLLKATMNGGFEFYKVPTASADNQTPTLLATLTSAGVFTPLVSINSPAVIGANIQATSLFFAGIYASQYGATISARNALSTFEWGHSNTGGYGSTIGFEASNGTSYICLSCGPGTNSDTYKTFGLAGLLLRSNNLGGLLVDKIVTANADNQTPTNLVTITSGGMKVAAHLESQGTAPAVGGSCGTSPSIIGTDVAGKVTAGSVAPTSCTVTFAVAWTNAPACFSVNETTANLSRAISTTTTVTLSGTMVAGDVLAYHCIGRL